MPNLVKNIDDLDARLLSLKLQEANQQDEIQGLLHNIKESVSPANLLKKTADLFSPGDLSSGSFINMAAGIAAGFIAKKIYKGKSAGIIKKITAPILQYIITVVVKNRVAKKRQIAQCENSGGIPGFTGARRHTAVHPRTTPEQSGGH